VPAPAPANATKPTSNNAKLPAPAKPPPPQAAPAKPSPPPSYPRDAAKPPLYPLDDAKGDPKKEAGLFGLKSGELPSLFGSSEESLAMRAQDLFADAIPSSPGSGVDDLDVPIDLNAPLPQHTRSDEEDSDDDFAPAADEGGGVALPLEDMDDANETERIDIPEPTFETAASSGEIAMPSESAGGDGLISMDELFSSQRKPEAAPVASAVHSAPAPIAHAPVPAAHAPAAEAPVAPAPVGLAGPNPFALIPVEGIPDARFDLPGGGVYLLGRDKDAHVKILSTSVSRRHARIDATGTDHVLIDLGSANGTQVNGQSVARQPLKEGDLIRMGKVILRYAGPGAR